MNRGGWPASFDEYVLAAVSGAASRGSPPTDATHIVALARSVALAVCAEQGHYPSPYAAKIVRKTVGGTTLRTIVARCHRCGSHVEEDCE